MLFVCKHQISTMMLASISVLSPDKKATQTLMQDNRYVFGSLCEDFSSDVKTDIIGASKSKELMGPNMMWNRITMHLRFFTMFRKLSDVLNFSVMHLMDTCIFIIYYYVVYIWKACYTCAWCWEYWIWSILASHNIRNLIIDCLSWLRISPVCQFISRHS